MICSHEKLRCTNNVFYCLACGARVPDPQAGRQSHEHAKSSQEEPKKAGKRKARKEEQV